MPSSKSASQFGVVNNTATGTAGLKEYRHA